MTKEQREQRILNNLGLAYSIAYFYYRKKQNRYIDKWDIIHYGILGLIKAIDTYDNKQKIKFSTYAYKCIKGSILNFLIKENYHKKNTISFNEKIGKNDDGSDILLVDVLVDNSFETVMEENDCEEQLKKEIYSYDYLIDTEKELLCVLFGICCEEQTPSEYARTLGISRQAVHQAIEKLFEKIREHGDLKEFVNHQL